MDPVSGASEFEIVVPKGIPNGKECELHIDTGVGSDFVNFITVYSGVIDGPCLIVDLIEGTVIEQPGMPSDLLTNNEYKSTKLVMRKIPAGTFMMGSPEKERGRDKDESLHQVTLTKDFYIGVFEVTQAQYRIIMESGKSKTPDSIDPSKYKGDFRPVENVSWTNIRGGKWPDGTCDPNSFIGRLQARTKRYLFDLPTEAQWEYACRAGTKTPFNSGEILTQKRKCPNMAEVGRYGLNNTSYRGGKADGKGEYADYHTTVGSYLPNAWGLYDMHGNVSEWCLDCYGEYNADAVDPVGEPSSTRRVIRGGAYSYSAAGCRSAVRTRKKETSYYYNIGFRLAFSGEHCLPLISGNVSSKTGKGKKSVTITLTGTSSSLTTLTNEKGNYWFQEIADGTYTIVPSLEGYNFNPPMLTVTISGEDSIGNNFQIYQ